MCSSVISQFIKSLHLLTLPSPLWAVHMDPKQEFLAILHVNVNSGAIIMDKGVVVAGENGTIKTSVSLNDEIVSNITPKIETVSDLSALIYSLQDVKVCLNVGASKCTKYVLNNDHSDFCDYCAFDVFSESREKEDMQPIFVDVNLDEFKPEKEKKHLCTSCGKTFNNRSSLHQHMLSHASSDGKPYKCKVCAKGFAKKYNLTVHGRIHSGERPYICSKCGKTYSTRSNLSTHLNSTHKQEKKHGCELCEMSFVHPRMLRIHMRKHTGEKPFMCPICGKVFAKNIHLTIHTRTHTGERPHVCRECGKGFTTTGNLNSHTKINHKM